MEKKKSEIRRKLAREAIVGRISSENNNSYRNKREKEINGEWFIKEVQSNYERPQKFFQIKHLIS